jgi:hypothetical protein
LPLGVEVGTPVSETGRAGALPAAAANFIQQRTNTSPPDERWWFAIYEHIDKGDRAGA